MSTENVNIPAAPAEVPGCARSSSSDWFSSLREYVTVEEIAKTKEVFDGHCSRELIVIATALRGLAESCDAAAQFANDDERPLKAEEFEQRAEAYRACYRKCVEAWDGHDEENHSGEPRARKDGA